MYVVHRVGNGVRKQNGSSNNASKQLVSSYRYGGFKADEHRKIALGFHWMKHGDEVNGLYNLAINNQTYPVLGQPAVNLTSTSDISYDSIPVITPTEGETTRYITAIPGLLKQTIYTWDTFSFPGDKRHFVHLHQTNEDKYDNNGVFVSSTRTTNELYDDSTQSVVSYGATTLDNNNHGSIGRVTVETSAPAYDPLSQTYAGYETYSTITNNGYHDTVSADKWHLGRLTRSTTSHSAPNQPTTHKASSFSYYPTSGLLECEYTYDHVNNTALGDDKQHTCYLYDAYGNKERKTTTANDVSYLGDNPQYTLTTRSTSTHYQGDLATALNSFNPTHITTNDAGHTEQVTSDAVYRKPLSQIGPNGIETTFSYNFFGQRTKTTRADGTQSTLSYHSCYGSTESSCVNLENAKYYTVSKEGYLANGRFIQSSATVKAFFDSYERGLRKETIALDGRTVYQDTEYFASGLVKRSSKPYFSGETAYWSYYQYDALGRTTIETNPCSIASSDALTLCDKTVTRYNGLETTTTNPLGQSITNYSNLKGQIIAVIDATQRASSYEYDTSGNLTVVRDVDGNEIVMKYDAIGRKLSMNDPDMGYWQYRYNGFGELVYQKDAKNQTSTMAYDALGRMTSRSEGDQTSSWVYDRHTYDDGTIGQWYGKLFSLSDNQNYQQEYHYDGYGRQTKVTTFIDKGLLQEQQYNTAYEYDTASRLEYINYPEMADQGAFRLRNEYDNKGYLSKIYSVNHNVFADQNKANYASTPIWQANSTNAAGQITNHLLGNGLNTQHDYAPSNGLVRSITTGFANGSGVQNLAYQFDSIGNLEWREDSHMQLNGISGVRETFGYDDLNRLTSTHVSGQGLSSSVQTLSMQYYANGNIKYKSGVGYYNYGQNGAGPHALTSISASEFSQRAGDANGDGQINSADIYLTVDDILDRTIAPGQPDCNQDTALDVRDLVCMRNNVGHTAGNSIIQYDANGNMLTDGDRSIIWSATNKPTMISKGNVSVQFRYGPDNKRYYREDTDANNDISKTYYIGGLMERIQKANGETVYKNYISAGGNTFAVYNYSTTQQQMRYLHKDHLGSINTITDENGDTVERFHYDAFGKRIATSWDTNFVAEFLSSSVTTRGYTGHEMMASVGLINMNARVYDPHYGRFLSADSKVVYPYSTQGFNRYSYTDNNPLSRVDPSGHGWLSKKWKQIKKGVKKYGLTIAAIAINIYMPGLGGAFLSGLVGSGGDFKAGLASMVTAGMFAGLHSMAPGLLKTLAHGAVGGISSVMNGGKFKDGFLSAGFTQSIQGFIGKDNIFPTKTSRVVAAAVAGGTASAIGGGKFANGAVTGAFSRLHNDENTMLDGVEATAKLKEVAGFNIGKFGRLSLIESPDGSWNISFKKGNLSYASNGNIATGSLKGNVEDGLQRIEIGGGPIAPVVQTDGSGTYSAGISIGVKNLKVDIMTPITPPTEMVKQAHPTWSGEYRKQRIDCIAGGGSNC